MCGDQANCYATVTLDAAGNVVKELISYYLMDKIIFHSNFFGIIHFQIQYIYNDNNSVYLIINPLKIT